MHVHIFSLEMQISMSAVMAFIAVSRCAIIPKDHIIVCVSRVMNLTVMAIHAVVGSFVCIEKRVVIVVRERPSSNFKLLFCGYEVIS